MPPLDRLVGLDVARGAAVLALIFVNISAFASTDFYLALLDNAPRLSGFAAVWDFTIGTLLLGKASGLLAFLLGAGLALQEDRARLREGSFAWLTMRRMSVLFLIGLAHIIFLWWGDILCAYALLGIGILVTRQLGPTGRRILAGVLLFGTLLGWTALGLLPAGDDPEFDEWAAKAISQVAQTYSTGSFSEILQIRLLEAILVQGIMLLMIPWFFAAALLGYDAIRTGWFPTAKTPISTRFLTVGASALIVSAAGAWAAQRYDASSPISWVGQMFGSLPAGLALSWCYLVALMRMADANSKLSLAFAAVGRTALTNYLLQSALAGFIFYSYGLGWFGTLGPGGTAGVAIAICAVQLACSRWWLERFRFGPMEWLWRVGTYAKFSLRTAP